MKITINKTEEIELSEREKMIFAEGIKRGRKRYIEDWVGLIFLFGGLCACLLSLIFTH